MQSSLFKRLSVGVGVLGLSLSLCAQTEYFLAVDGEDGNDGRSEARAFATLQRGVDALVAGDTLTLLPGSYLGSARSVRLGNDRETTRIRALISGTAVVHGDVPAPAFQKLDGYRHVYAAPFAEPVHGINDLDRLRVLSETVSVGDVELRPGVFYHDAEAGILYLSTPGFESAEGGRFSIGVIPEHGLHLSEPRNLIIEGLDFRGFQKLGETDRQDRAGNTTWGLFIKDGFRCVVQDCRAYFNNRGIGLSSAGVGRGTVAGETEIGYNTLQYCTAWANRTIYGRGGALNLFSPNRDQIRNSFAFLNGGVGIRMYQGDHYGLVYGNLAWGNGADFDLKAHVSVTSLRNVGPGTWGSDSVRRRVVHSLVGRIASVGEQYADNIILDDLSATAERRLYHNLDPAAEFADPFNQDYRLQSNSRFRGAAGNGVDLGPFDFTPTVFFVSPEGDDAADGLSSAAAWRTLTHAASQLKAGDTLYLFPGRHDEPLTLRGLHGTREAPLRLRTRGAGAAILNGPVTLEDCSHVEVQSLAFRAGLTVVGGEAVTVVRSRFDGDAGLRFENTHAPRIVHNDFAVSGASALSITGQADAFISGNDFSHATGGAVTVDISEAVRYANFNTYAAGGTAWRVGDDTRGADAFPNRWETDSVAVTVGDPPGAGPYGRLAGAYAVAPETSAIASTPELLAATATTANFEWVAAETAIFTVAWGTTPETPNRARVHGQSFFTFSLSDLEPDTTYYFRLIAAETIARNDDDEDYGLFRIDATPLRFTTAASDPPAKVYYLGPDGDDAAHGGDPANAWRSFFHATTQLRPGDTLQVLGGVYAETVRVRTTGTADAPITIRAAPDATVVFDSEGSIPNYVIVDYKDHIHIDGFHFYGVSRHGESRLVFPGSAIRARQANHLSVSRCLLDGRVLYYSGSLGSFFDSSHVTLSNCVQIDNMSRLLIVDCPHFRIEHSVFLRPKIAPITIVNPPGKPIVIRNTLITDSQPSKSGSLLIEIGRHETLEVENIGLFLRRPAGERVLFGIYGEAAYSRSARTFGVSPLDDAPAHPTLDVEVVRASVVDWFADYAVSGGGFVEGDPEFALFAAHRDAAMESIRNARERRPTTQSLDWMTSNPHRRGGGYAFSDFFLTHPEFTERGIGLQPDAFADLP